MAGATTGQVYTMAADDYIRWRIRLECQRVGCETPTTVFWSMWDERIRHGDQDYAVLQGPYEGSWLGIVGWLDTLHAPLVAQRQAEQASQRLMDLWPLRTVDPLIGG